MKIDSKSAKHNHTGRTFWDWLWCLLVAVSLTVPARASDHTVATVPLSTLVGDSITLLGDGMTTSRISLRLHNSSKEPLQVLIPAYTQFAPEDSTKQALSTLQTTTVTLLAGQTLDVEVETVCSDLRSKPPPTAAGGRYRITRSAPWVVAAIEAATSQAERGAYDDLPMSRDKAIKTVRQLALWRLAAERAHSQYSGDQVTLDMILATVSVQAGVVLERLKREQRREVRRGAASIMAAVDFTLKEASQQLAQAVPPEGQVTASTTSTQDKGSSEADSDVKDQGEGGKPENGRDSGDKAQTRDTGEKADEKTNGGAITTKPGESPTDPPPVSVPTPPVSVPGSCIQKYRFHSEAIAEADLEPPEGRSSGYGWVNVKGQQDDFAVTLPAPEPGILGNRKKTRQPWIKVPGPYSDSHLDWESEWAAARVTLIAPKPTSAGPERPCSGKDGIILKGTFTFTDCICRQPGACTKHKIVLNITGNIDGKGMSSGNTAAWSLSPSLDGQDLGKKGATVPAPSSPFTIPVQKKWTQVVDTGVIYQTYMLQVGFAANGGSAGSAKLSILAEMKQQVEQVVCIPPGACE